MNWVGGAGLSVAIERPASHSLQQEVLKAVHAACDFLLNRQRSQGYWIGEIEGDASLAADYVLLQLWLHQPDSAGRWNPPTRGQVDAACAWILGKQLPDGGWNVFAGGPANASASVKAYSALRLGGIPASDARMQAAAKRVLELGGVEAANSYTKLYLSYFGLFPREQVPSIPPELFLLPPGHPFSIYGMSAWSRAMLAPLSILDATKARRRAPEGVELREILSGCETVRADRFSWKGLFRFLDEGIKFVESTSVGSRRQRGIQAATKWMIEHLEGSDGLAAIFPAMVNSIMALTQLGYGLDHPLLKRQIEHFEGLILDDEDGFRVQPCLSPVWDTASTTYAIGSAQPNSAAPVRWALGRAADWLVSKQTRRYGDWSVRQPDAEPGGWCFEHRNEHYPDMDDTAEVLLALEWAKGADRNRQRGAEQRGLDWLVSMQAANGGWAAFDCGDCPAILAHLPFADHNAMLDPACADITGRVLEALCRRAPGRYRDAVRKGVAYLLHTQEDDGCWHGRWGINYLYGTCFAVRGLRAAGAHPRDAAVIRAGEWVRSIQNPDGGWGESAASYDDPTLRAAGESTPSQTAWALMALFATDDFESSSAREGVLYLLETQTPDGTWQEDEFTGTGFPRVFYLRYHMYPQYFPLMALGEYNHWATRE